ncbi:Methyl-accepting chemotaxis protein [Labilithrix luteola]|uniref:Methyl-accepting chemotaxis protein n=1 Tax=Labilithrix luteola TaxID=1391654 RepID=A0A0K1PYV6_9BACT|nr:Methyl-accepting chemotaxis protein [Labilithrix luteola]
MSVVVTITLVAQLLTSRLLESAHDGDYQLMRQVLADLLHDTEDKALSRAEIVAAMPSVRTAFINRDRAKLLAECQKMFELQGQKYGLDQAQFHVPPGVSFLRLDRPEKFGEDETGFRPILAEVHQTKVVRKGTGITRVGPAVFGIVPIQDDAGKLVGSFEMGLELAPELDTIKESFGLEATVFFEERLLREIATDVSPEVLTPKNRVGKYTRFHSTHPELAAALVTDKDVDVNEPRTYERTVAGTSWGVQLVPLYSEGNKQIGVVALSSNFGEDTSLAHRALVWQLLAALFGIVMMVGAILVVVRGVLLAPLAALNERMSALASGDASKEADPADSYCAELRELAANYEKLRSEKQR